MAEKKSCFIIMPITTPETHIKTYRDETDHFKHVLECLIIPAVEKADMKPIPPKAKGSDLIQAEIIKNLETSDLVLCDMSTLNPNVFFEFGIRTSLNKPVCVIKDEQTKKVPFDTGILNYQEYKSTIEAWDIKSEIERLSEQLSESLKRSKNENTLWKYLGLKSEARPFESTNDSHSQFDLLQFKLDSISNQLDTINRSENGPQLTTVTDLMRNIRDESAEYERINNFIKEFIEAKNYKFSESLLTVDSNRKIVYFSPKKLMPSKLITDLRMACKNIFGYELIII